MIRDFFEKSKTAIIVVLLILIVVIFSLFFYQKSVLSKSKSRSDSLNIALVSKDSINKKLIDSISVFKLKITNYENLLIECNIEKEKYRFKNQIKDEECLHEIEMVNINNSVDKSDDIGELLMRVGQSKTLQDAERIFLPKQSHRKSTESNNTRDFGKETKSTRLNNNLPP